MSQVIRVVVLNTDEQAAPELRAFLLSIEGVKIVAEVDEPAMLPSVLAQIPSEILLLHLDPNPAAIMQVVGPTIEATKDTVAAIGMTEDREAELVIRAMRVGMREFLWKPFNPEQLSEIIRKVGTELRERKDRETPQSGKLICVVGTVGGVGATCLATNLAVELAQLDPAPPADAARKPAVAAPRVAVVDLDFRFGQVATLMDAQPTYTIAELCDSPEQADMAMIERAMLKHSTGVHILARPSTLQQAENITAAQCASVLAVLQEHYQYVVVDGPCRFDHQARLIIEQSDCAILTIQLLVPSVRNADRLIHELRDSGFNTERIRLLCNRVGREAGYLEPADVETILSRKVDWFIPDDWKTSSTAVNMGTPLLLHAPKSKIRTAYREVALALAGADCAAGEAEAPAESGRKGLFSLFGEAKKSR